MASNNLGFDLDQIGRLRRSTHSIALNTSLVTGETTPRHQSRLNNAPALPLSLECKGRLPSLTTPYSNEGGSVAEWVACWTQAQKGDDPQIAAATLSGSSLRQTVHTHRASVHQAAKSVAAFLRVARVTAGLAESNGSLPPGL